MQGQVAGQVLVVRDVSRCGVFGLLYPDSTSVCCPSL
jgi:hypothetical protein